MAELLALREEQLVAQADPEVRPAGVDVGTDRLDEPEALEGLHRVGEGAVAGHDQRPGLLDRAGIVGDDGRTEARQGLLHAPEIAAPVVDDRDHKAPLVEGMPWTRGFKREASARARPKALKRASAMWWTFSP